ncbi:uncharacterized protein [Diabrotica undecimpunctata]|uniref:uncharacterized protein n=1 Tax=Diabrotica undecimpunctata TaxID=50387 RepID=UPI003B63A8D8
MRRAHPDEYNGDLERRYENPGRRVIFTDEDLIRMGHEELRYEGRFIFQHLMGLFPDNTKEQIRSARKKSEYREFLESLREEERRRNRSPSPVAGPANTETFANYASSEGEPSPVRISAQGESDTLSPPGLNNAGRSRDTPLSADVPNPEVDEPVPLRNRETIASYMNDYYNTKTGWSEEEQAIFRYTQYANAERHRVRVRSMLNEYITVSITASAGKRKKQVQPNTRNSKASNALAIENRRRQRAQRYRLTQTRYHTDRSALARAIIDAKPLYGSNVHPQIRTVEREYRKIFSSRSPTDDEPISDQKDPLLISYAVTEAEILGTLQTMKSQAAGPDLLKIRELRKVPVQKLVLVYNTMLHYGVTPEVLRDCRTTLIPKGGDPLEVGNWRPITISSVLVRVLHCLLGKRLAVLDFHELQRGFRQVDGVLLNNLTLQAVIKERRRGLRPYNIISIDLRKAFDTVSQRSIERAMTRFGLDASLSGMWRTRT